MQMNPHVRVTYLEMRSADSLRPKRCHDPRFAVRECVVPQWQFNRFLYLTVGEAWSWTDQREWSDEQWREYVEGEHLGTFAASVGGSPAGYYELLRGEAGEIQIAYFGLLPAFIGRGYGGALLTSALEEGWRMGASRIWVHTCSLDHPASLRNYEARGMKIFKVKTIEPS